MHPAVHQQDNADSLWASRLKIQVREIKGGWPYCEIVWERKFWRPFWKWGLGNLFSSQSWGYWNVCQEMVGRVIFLDLGFLQSLQFFRLWNSLILFPSLILWYVFFLCGTRLLSLLLIYLSELHYCTGAYRISPVDVNSRPSSCLTNFLLNGKDVSLTNYFQVVIVNIVSRALRWLHTGR